MSGSSIRGSGSAAAATARLSQKIAALPARPAHARAGCQAIGHRGEEALPWQDRKWARSVRPSALPELPRTTADRQPCVILANRKSWDCVPGLFSYHSNAMTFPQMRASGYFHLILLLPL